MKNKLNILCLIFLFFICCSTVFPCSYVDNWSDSEPPCKKYNKSELVAFGKVSKIDVLKVPKNHFTEEYQIVFFKIKETFKGDSEEIIKFKRRMNGCGSIFEVGGEYITYSKPDEETPGFHKMSQDFTKVKSEDFKREIDYLKIAKKGKAGATISGIIVNSHRKTLGDEIEHIGIKNIEVLIKSDKSEHKLTTDKNGKFLLYGLKAGEYIASLNMFSWKGEQLSMTLSLDKDSCENIWAKKVEQGYIKGTLLNPNGDFADDIELELIAIDPKTNKPTEDTLSVETYKDGDFFFESIPEGKYLLAHNNDDDESDEKIYTRLYYPGVKDFNLSSVIEVKNKQAKDLGVFRLVSNKSK